ncbi:MAG: ABC transporter ATP-binding protein [Austwickia sp.]|nr:ABC transporter ATP-binding protein [Austwickia sp.]
MTGITITGLVKRYGRTPVLTDISVQLAPGRIHGLLGANGVGKTTLLACLCRHTFATAGTVLIDGIDPAVDSTVLARTCFIREDQRYPDQFRLGTVLEVAPAFYPTWDPGVAARLIERFRLPLATRAKKLSRGQRSALAITIALASGAPYTVLDEPYLGLDAGARAIFYEELLVAYGAAADDAVRRTFIVSTHLVDEAAELLEEVVLLDSGRLVFAGSTEDASTLAFRARGGRDAVHTVAAGRSVVEERSLGPVLTAVVLGPVSAQDHARAGYAGVELSPLTLQELVAVVGEHRLGAQLAAPWRGSTPAPQPLTCGSASSGKDPS